MKPPERTIVTMAKKVWFITGSSRGFGRHWAEAALLARAGERSHLAGVVGRWDCRILRLGSLSRLEVGAGRDERCAVARDRRVWYPRDLDRARRL